MKCPRCDTNMLVMKKMSANGKLYIIFYLCIKCKKIWKLTFKEVEEETDIYW